MRNRMTSFRQSVVVFIAEHPAGTAVTCHQIMTRFGRTQQSATGALNALCRIGYLRWSMDHGQHEAFIITNTGHAFVASLA